MKRTWLVFILPLVFIACPKEEIDPPDQMEIQVEKQIGPGGGIIENGTLFMNIPPGTFDENYTVKVSEEAVYNGDFGENMITPAFRISGFPSRTSGPIHVRIKYDTPPGGENYLAFGSVDNIAENEEESVTYSLIEAVDSAGYLVAHIPPIKEEEIADGARKSTLFYPGLIMVVYGVGYMATYKDVHFNYTYHSSLDPQEIYRLAQQMEEAMDHYFALGLVDKPAFDAAASLFGRPTFVITGKKKQDANPTGVSLPALASLEGGVDESDALARYHNFLDISINMSGEMLVNASAQELSAWAHIWAYRLLYYLYRGDRLDWYGFASTYYMQEKFSGMTAYKESLFPTIGMSPFTGMRAGIDLYGGSDILESGLGGRISIKETYHANGMVPFIKHIDQRYPGDPGIWKRIILETLNSESRTPMEGIINALPDPEYVWWPGFFKNYLTRQLVDVPAEEFLKTLKNMDQIDFFHEKDTVRFNDFDYEDLSAKLYQVNFLFPAFEKEAKLNLKLGPASLNMDYVTAMAFGIRNGNFEYFDQAPNLTIPELKTLQEAGYSSIAVLVVNSASEPARSEPMNIWLETSLKTAPQDFNYVLVEVMQARSQYTDNYGDSSEGTVLMLDGTPRKGSMSGNTFTATWSEPQGTGTSSGTIIIEFDPENFPYRVVGYSITETITFSDTRKFTFLGEDIDFWGSRASGTIPAYWFWASGTEVCNYLTFANEEYASYDGTYSYSTDGSVTCDDKSDINIKLYYLEE